jgi:hypothetical protein
MQHVIQHLYSKHIFKTTSSHNFNCTHINVQNVGDIKSVLNYVFGVYESKQTLVKCHH